MQKPTSSLLASRPRYFSPPWRITFRQWPDNICFKANFHSKTKWSTQMQLLNFHRFVWFLFINSSYCFCENTTKRVNFQQCPAPWLLFSLSWVIPNPENPWVNPLRSHAQKNLMLCKASMTVMNASILLFLLVRPSCWQMLFENFKFLCPDYHFCPCLFNSITAKGT